ncbi:MAG: metallophosphoesterase [Longimicrobiaceae bacterium]
MNRRRFLAALAAGGATLGGYARFGEPRRLEVTRHAVDPLPIPSRPPLTLAQVTDLHLQRVGSLHRRIAGRLARARPDLVLFTGDSIDRADRLPVLAEFLALLGPRIPGYAILGNWEHWGGVDLEALARLYARHGVRLLVNETAVHAHQGRRLAITGLDDLVGGRPDLAAAVRGAEPADSRVLLAHCPAHRDGLRDDQQALRVGGTLVRPGVDLAALDFRLMLSGHTHGGQVAFLGAAPMLPQGSGRYARGWFREPGEIPMYVSRGIGTSVVPVRFGSVPEVALFTLWV